MVGSAICRRLAAEDCEIIALPRAVVDLRRQSDIEAWIETARPDAVFIAAATVGGIQANSSRPAEFLYDNLVIETNLIEASKKVGVEKLLFMGSACIYPRMADQPMAEEALLTGPLEPTNEWYAIAKIAGIKLCQAYRRQYDCDFISAMPNNLYGPGDNFDLESSHVVPALIRKAHESKVRTDASMTVWGTGRQLREFLYVEDLADALVFLMERYSGELHVNVGSGEEVSIRELNELICRVVGFEGSLEFDTSKPDGMPRKLLDVTMLQDMGWEPTTSLEEGLRLAYDWFLSTLKD
jgi:GDP-L-fucose synthase